MSLKPEYHNRKQEVQAHLGFIKMIERRTKKSQLKSVTILQQNILKASFFIHLYSLIESTLSLCISEVEININKHHISDFLSFKKKIQRLWIKHYFQLNNTTNNNDLEKRIDFTHEAYTNTLDTSALFKLKIKEKLRTVDNKTFDNVANKLDLNIPKNIKDIIMKNRYDGKNTLEMIRAKRDKLAHGELSYSDVGNYTYADLESLFNEVCTYLDNVVEVFEKYISEEGYKLKEDAVDVEEQ